jgi:hypothetical protein
MADTLLLHTLRRKRAYLQGEIEAKECQIGCLRDDLETIDRMIRLIDAETDPNSIKGIRPYPRLEGFRHGEYTWLCLSVLRQAGEPLSIVQIAREIASRKDILLTALLIDRIRCAVKRLRKRGRLRRFDAAGCVKWSLTE